jgi:halogenation protein CepH
MPVPETKTIQSDYDVIVVGGGPAGSTTSTLIAHAGLRVGLFERERFFLPQHAGIRYT